MIETSTAKWHLNSLAGAVGALLTGVFAAEVWGGTAGAIDGEIGMIGIQAIAILGAALFSGVGTWILLKVLSFVVTFRRPLGEEGIGLDVVLHGEEAYAKSEGAVLVHPDGAGSSSGTTAPDAAATAVPR